MSRAVVLFSGGLDSMLSVRILQRQGLEVDALNIRTIFSCCRASAAQTAVALGARLTVTHVGDDYISVIRHPQHGYGKGVNPCIDCRIYMCRMARRFMEEVGACVVATGEIAGQRPMSQKKYQLELIARRSGLEDRLLRPLSAKLLPPTVVERDGIVDRQQLYAFHGRGRGKLIDLARELGIAEIPSPSTGCALTERSFAPRVRDLLKFHPRATRWDFELLNCGRHVRLDPYTKIVLGRNAEENATLRLLAAREDKPEAALLMPEDFLGPDALVVGRVHPSAIERAGAWMLRYAGKNASQRGRVRVAEKGGQRVISVRGDETVRTPTPL